MGASAPVSWPVRDWLQQPGTWPERISAVSHNRLFAPCQGSGFRSGLLVSNRRMIANAKQRPQRRRFESIVPARGQRLRRQSHDRRSGLAGVHRSSGSLGTRLQANSPAFSRHRSQRSGRRSSLRAWCRDYATGRQMTIVNERIDRHHGLSQPPIEASLLNPQPPGNCNLFPCTHRCDLSGRTPPAHPGEIPRGSRQKTHPVIPAQHLESRLVCRHGQPAGFGRLFLLRSQAAMRIAIACRFASPGPARIFEEVLQ